MKTASRWAAWVMFGVGSVIWLGCGKPAVDAPQTYAVSIKITYHDQPVSGANVTLIPQVQSGRGAAGLTDDSGLAKMGLPGLTDGAVPGKYWVSVSKVESAQVAPNVSADEFYAQQTTSEDAPPSSPKQLLPTKYLGGQTGGLECEVKEQPDQTFEFSLTD